MALAHDVTEVLNDLIQTCLDGESGFQSASNAMNDPALQKELAGYASQRRNFAGELRNRVIAEQEDPTEHGSVSGALHRGWLNIRTAISSNDRHAILAECERGEDVAVENYRKAIEADLPSEYDGLIQAQYDEVLRTHDRIRSLRDMT